ncbi:BMC domain-containing protein [Streptococcus suis]|nr:BMC domain-containing protein [Streptococcus suis]
MKALGLIETYGFIGAIEAADVMLKVANVTLLKLEKVRGGLVTISVEGDVGAIKTAVEAGAASVTRLTNGKLISSHVIPRPDYQLSSFFRDEQSKSYSLDEKSVEQEVLISDLSEQAHHDTVEVTDQDNQAESTEESEEVPTVVTVSEYKKQLEKKKAAELRGMIAENENISISEEKLSQLVRKTMIAMLLDDFVMQVGDM